MRSPVPGSGGGRPPARRRLDLRLAGLLAAVLLSALATAVPGSWAALSAVVSNPTNTVATAKYFTCASALTASGPAIYYKLDETTGTTAVDASGNTRNGTYQGTVTKGVSRACPRDTGSAVAFNGSSGYVTSDAALTTPTSGFTAETWFKTTSTTGGLLLGFGSATGASLSVDRVLYITNGGRLFFGVNNLTKNTINSSTRYHDGSWHHVMATAGSAGMRLYVDGVEVASSTTTIAGSYSGHLRLGYDTLLGWPNSPSSNHFDGSLDEAAVYLKVLTAADATSRFTAAR